MKKTTAIACISAFSLLASTTAIAFDFSIENDTLKPVRVIVNKRVAVVNNNSNGCAQLANRNDELCTITVPPFEPKMIVAHFDYVKESWTVTVQLEGEVSCLVRFLTLGVNGESQNFKVTYESNPPTACENRVLFKQDSSTSNGEASFFNTAIDESNFKGHPYILIINPPKKEEAQGEHGKE